MGLYTQDAYRGMHGITSVLGSGGKVTGIECIRMELGEPDESGRIRAGLPII